MPLDCDATLLNNSLVKRKKESFVFMCRCVLLSKKSWYVGCRKYCCGTTQVFFTAFSWYISYYAYCFFAFYAGMGLGGTKTVIGDHHHPAGLQTLMESHQTQRNNRDQHYCIVKSTDHPSGGGGGGGQGEDPVRYKTIDSTGLSYLYIHLTL